jgi:hydroxyacylglutathione hydrolase
MRVVPVPCLSDNYAYLVHREGAREALVVDPSEAEPVRAALAREGLVLGGILATHHHHDHVGGIDELVCERSDVEVLGSTHDKKRIPRLTRALADRETVCLAGIDVHALSVPGHTLGALAFHLGDELFTGDTLFVAGCGRLFEGTPADMHRSLSGVLAKLPRHTRVWCGHEYTEANLRFAAAMEPEHGPILAALERVREARGRGEATVPSTIGAELEHNPFMRPGSAALRERAGTDDPVGVLAWVRAAKDTFRG